MRTSCLGCLDGYQQRDYLEGAARRYCLPLVDIGMDVAMITEQSYAVAGQMIMTRPGGPCLRCLGFITPERLAREENRYGDAGINSQVVWTNGTLASLAVGAFVKLVSPWFPAQKRTHGSNLTATLRQSRPVASRTTRLHRNLPAPRRSRRTRRSFLLNQ